MKMLNKRCFSFNFPSRAMYSYVKTPFHFDGKEFDSSMVLSDNTAKIITVGVRKLFLTNIYYIKNKR